MKTLAPQCPKNPPPGCNPCHANHIRPPAITRACHTRQHPPNQMPCQRVSKHIPPQQNSRPHHRIPTAANGIQQSRRPGTPGTLRRHRQTTQTPRRKPNNAPHETRCLPTDFSHQTPNALRPNTFHLPPHHATLRTPDPQRETCSPATHFSTRQRNLFSPNTFHRPHQGTPGEIHPLLKRNLFSCNTIHGQRSETCSPPTHFALWHAHHTRAHPRHCTPPIPKPVLRQHNSSTPNETRSLPTQFGTAHRGRHTTTPGRRNETRSATTHLTTRTTKCAVRQHNSLPPHQGTPHQGMPSMPKHVLPQQHSRNGAEMRSPATDFAHHNVTPGLPKDHARKPYSP